MTLIPPTIPFPGTAVVWPGFTVTLPGPPPVQITSTPPPQFVTTHPQVTQSPTTMMAEAAAEEEAAEPELAAEPEPEGNHKGKRRRKDA